MADALNTYYAIIAWKQRKPGHEKEWQAQHPDEWNTIQLVNKLRKPDGKHN